ncbi:MAG: PQQ-binding-like beta-propeller repeat protein [Planctomycetes bacterium]|nr:PQQ-binding-like beta-propeller repeat protein [Planctomycetota bacterium]MBL7146422.1 PQQ-binding-like beta-propeller repeat protein [Phycisphaerae bacterium]
METKRIRAAALALIVTASICVSLSFATNVDNSPGWPEFHGSGRKNISPDIGLLKKWPEGGPQLLWKYSQCGKGFSGVAIARGMIFTAGDFGREEMVIALDMDGNLLWKMPNGEAWRGPSPGSRATPTYNDGAVYHMNPDGRLAAYEAPSGEQLWAVDLKSQFDAKFGIWAFAENVIVDGDKVLCMPGGPKSRVVALDKRTGKTLWVNTEIEHSAAYCSGIVVTNAGLRQLINMTQRSVFGLNVETGKLVWSAPFVPMSPQNALRPVFQDGYVFIACGHSSGGTLLKTDPGSNTASTVWHRRDLDDCHSGTVLLNGKLYGSACRQGGRCFYCVDFLTGKTIKLDSTLGKVGITCADGMIYALNHQGTMSLLAVTPDGFDIVSQFELTRKPANSYLAHPVVCGGKLYIRCDQDLYVYDVRAN